MAAVAATVAQKSWGRKKREGKKDGVKKGKWATLGISAKHIVSLVIQES